MIFLVPNPNYKTFDVVYIVPLISRISQHCQSSELDAVFLDKGTGPCALPRPGAVCVIVVLKCQSGLKIVPCFSSLQKSSLGKKLKLFHVLHKNSGRPASAACAASAGTQAFQCTSPLVALAAFAGGDAAWWWRDGATRFPSCQSCILLAVQPGSASFPTVLSVLPPCSLPSAALSSLCPASASNTTKLIWLQSSETPARDGMLVSLISAAGLTGKQNGGVWWERESTGGGGGGLTSGVRGWRKVRQQKKGKELWEMGRKQNSSSGRNQSMNKNSFANCTGGGRWNPTGNGVSGFVARVRGIINGEFLWNRKRKTDLLKTKQGKLGGTAISQI